MRRALIILLSTLLLGLSAIAESVTIEAGRDATLIEHPEGALANGMGPLTFVGRTGQSQNGTRRGLLHFDVAGSLPRRAIIESASVTLYMSSGNTQISELRLHRVQADWGEGPSVSGGGSGAPADTGDATWIHTYHDQEFWVHTGGDFVGRVSAGLPVSAPGYYTWESTNHLVQDVRLWNSRPSRNFGWILIGDETVRGTAKKFASREHPDAAVRPVLEVSYRLPGDRRNE